MCINALARVVHEPGGNKGNNNRVKNGDFNGEWPKFRAMLFAYSRLIC
ncbi:hypothetical protein G51EAM_00679 [Candidatus Nanoperiomorbus periodonticus]|nr:hypothetical protein G51EAM_00679 [Candidatus Nanoperiomorbus periodonticus]